MNVMMNRIKISNILFQKLLLKFYFLAVVTVNVETWNRINEI